MAGRRKTAFERYVAERKKKSATFAEEYRRAKAEIRATDDIVRRLNTERERAKMTKAELARRAGMPAETIRKLFTADGANPTVNTISRLAAELGLSLHLVKRG